MREKIISRLPLRCYRDAEERILNKISPPTFMPKTDVEDRELSFLRKMLALCCVRIVLSE